MTETPPQLGSERAAASGRAPGTSGQPATGRSASGPVNRMAVAVLSLIGVFLAFYLLANNLGWTPPIPCGSGDCDVVQSSRYAWIGPAPVSAIGLAGYLALFALSIAGLQRSLVRSRAIALLLFAGALAGVLFSAYLTYLEAVVIQAWCRYCVASAILIAVVFLATLPELKRIRA